MRNKVILPIILSVVLIVGALACRLWPRTIPTEKCSGVYQKYFNKEGINATFIKNYKADKTIMVDVTLLEATDSLGWKSLKADFKVPEDTGVVRVLLDAGHNIIWTQYGYADNPCIKADSTVDKRVVVAISPLQRCVCIFHSKDSNEAKAIFTHNLNHSINNSK